MGEKSRGRYLIIGLGRFGTSVLETLLDAKSEVIVFDNDEEKIKLFKDVVETAIVLDATNEEALKKFDLSDIDAAIVTMGEFFESNLLTTVLLKQMNVKRVISRASTAIEEKILKKVGADTVIFPEVEMGKKLANTLLRKSVEEAIPLSDGNSIVHVKAPLSFHHKSLKEIDLRKNYSINVVALKRMEDDKEKTYIPDSDTKIEEHDLLIIVGSNENIDRFIKEQL